MTSKEPPATTEATRARPWRFTLNNWTLADETALHALLGYKYLVFGKEVGESGTPHLQGLIIFTNKKSMKQVSSLIPRANLDVCYDPPAMAEYCKKENDFYQDGTAPQSKKTQGETEKKRYQRAWELAKDPNADFEDIDADIRVRLYGTIKRIRADFQVAPTSMPTLDFHWYYGPSGTGKSRKAREENPQAYIKNTNKWWDGYVDQDVVIIEEWNPSMPIPLQQYLKTWCDHHSFTAETKGSTMCIRPPKIIITSNYSLEECFGHDPAGLLQPLKRRLSALHFPGNTPFKLPGAMADGFHLPAAN